jgi:hypothetical protein
MCITSVSLIRVETGTDDGLESSFHAQAARNQQISGAGWTSFKKFFFGFSPILFDFY